MNRNLLVSLLMGILLLGSCNKKSTPASTAENNAQTSASQPAPPAETVPPPSQSAVAPANTEQAVEPPPPTAPAKKRTVETARPVPPPPPQPVVIPAGTVITVRLQQPLSSKSNKPGDRFEATLSQPLSVNGKTVLPNGTLTGGTVTDAKDAGRFKGAATLNLALDTIVVQGTHYQVETTEITQTSKGKGKRSAAMIGGGAGAGALIGGLAGGGKGAAIGTLVGAGAGTAGAGLTGNNNDINLAAEAAISFKLKAPLTLKPMQPSTQATE